MYSVARVKLAISLGYNFFLFVCLFLLETFGWFMLMLKVENACKLIYCKLHLEDGFLGSAVIL